MPESPARVAVVPDQAVHCSEPEETVLILVDGEDHVVGDPLIEGDLFDPVFTSRLERSDNTPQSA